MCFDMAIRYAGRGLTNIADTCAHALLHCHDLVYDLVLPQVPSEAALASRAEGAPHGAADLHAQVLACGHGCQQVQRGASCHPQSSMCYMMASYSLLTLIMAVQIRCTSGLPSRQAKRSNVHILLQPQGC